MNEDKMKFSVALAIAAPVTFIVAFLGSGNTLPLWDYLYYGIPTAIMFSCYIATLHMALQRDGTAIFQSLLMTAIAVPLWIYWAELDLNGRSVPVFGLLVISLYAGDEYFKSKDDEDE